MSQAYLQEDLSFLLHLQEQGIFLHADGKDLVCDAEHGSITEEIASYIRENKCRLLTLLRSMERDENLPRIVPDPENAYEPFPLTENQEAYWLGRNEKLDSGGVGVHVFFEMMFEDFDKQRFEAAWNEVVSKQAMLRAVLLPEGRQRVLESVPPVVIHEEFLTDLNKKNILEKARQSISHMQYELFEWPQFHMEIFHLPKTKDKPRQSILMASVDMWCLDLRSLQVVLDHLADAYLGKTPSKVPAPGFRDYLITLQELHQLPIYDKALSYWRERIANLPAAPILPIRPQSEVQTGHFTRRSKRFTKEQWQNIRTKLRKKGLTTSSVLLACYAATISRWSETKRFTLNIPRYNRLPLHDDINDIVGEFASFSLLEVDNSSSSSFEDLARRIQRQMWADLEFSHVSGVRVLRDWKKTMDSPPSVMAPFVFTSEPEHSVSDTTSRKGPAKPLKSLSWIGALERIGTVCNLVTQTPQVWLDSQFSEIRGDLYVSWDSLDGLFVEGLPERMFDAYCDLIASLIHDSAWESAEIGLPDKELPFREILTGLKEDLPTDTPAEMLLHHAESHPREVAIIDKQGSMTWRDVFSEVAFWSSKLGQLGLTKGNAVAFALPKGRKQFLASMAIHFAGGIIIPLDHESPLSRMEAIIADSGAAVLLTDSQCQTRLSSLSCPVIDMDVPETMPVLQERPDPHDTPLYCMIYTSGSTGTPKGVMMPLKGLLNMIQDSARRFGLGRSDTILALNPIYHDFALFDMMAAAIHGATLVFPTPERLKDPGHWLDLIHTHSITVWDTVPATMTMMLDYMEGAESSHYELESLRLAFLGGDWIPLDTPNRLTALAPNATVVSIGGPTEVSVWNLLYPVEQFNSAWRSIPYGYPIRNAVYHILDKKLEDCPAMVVGEMYCSGAGLTNGYMNDKEKTNEAFFTHPTKNIPMFKTGDLGRLHENGYIEFIGRRDNQVNINGYRIELGEVETAMGRHPSVSQAVAVVKTNLDSNDGLILWITLKPGEQCETDDLRAYLAQHVPKYMMPTAIGTVETLPLTQNNKIDRASIAGWETPKQQHSESEERPTTPTQKLLEKEWESLLGLKGLTLDQNFFEIGGNSIAAVRLYNSIIAGKYKGMSVASIFSFPTIRDLAIAIDEAPKIGSQEDEPTPDAKTKTLASVNWPKIEAMKNRLPMVPATRVQQRMFYEDRRQGNHCFNLCLQVAVHAEKGREINSERIKTAFNAIVARHEILRTNFVEQPDADNSESRRVMQRIHAERSIPLERVDLPKNQDREKALNSFCHEFTQRPYDLEQGPLLRIALVSDTPTEGRLFIGFHHLALDGWSLTLLLQDLSAALDGKELSTPPLQQADIAVWENSPAFTQSAEQLLPFAAGRISAEGVPSVITDGISLNEIGTSDIDEDCHVQEYIPQPVMDKIVKLSETNGSTPFAVMCTVFGLLAADYNASDNAQFGTYVAVRAMPGLEDALGSLTAPAPLLLHLNREKSLAEAARETMIKLSESIDLSLIPFEELVKAIAPIRRGGELPLFGMAFTFDNTPAQTLTAGEMSFSPLGVHQYQTSIDLEASVSMDAIGTRVMIVFNPQKLRLNPVKDFMRRFIHMLAQVADNPELPLHSISPMTQQDAHIHNDRFTPAELKVKKNNLLEYFYQIEQSHPDFTALTETRSGQSKPEAVRSCTLKELRQKADDMTAALIAHGVKAGDRIALLMPRGIELTAAMLAAQQSGAVFMLIPPAQAQERAEDIIQAGLATLICCNAETLGHPACNNRQTLDISQVRALSPKEREALPICTAKPETDLCLFFTSGSEGRPKGVRLTHGNWINRLEGDWQSVPYAENEACISKSITSFIDSFSEIFQPLLKKIPLFFLPDGEEADVESLILHLNHWKVTRAMIVVSLTQSILEVLRQTKTDLDSLRHVMSSGERLPTGLVEEFYQLLPQCTLHNYYGSTEVSADVARCRISPLGEITEGRIVPLGSPMPNSRIEIMNPAGSPLPHGMVGKIAISGPSVSPGYLNEDESGFFEYDGLHFFAPGDYGMWTENGELLGFGRSDRQIKIRGQRIETGDVEQIIRRSSKVSRAAVFASGSGMDATLTACVVLHKPGIITMEDLRRNLRHKLSGAMLPSRLIEVNDIPQTESGKIDLKALESNVKQQLKAPLYKETELKNDTEKMMATIWETLLGTPIGHRHVDFFANGGHSLIAIRLVALIRKNFGVSLRIKDIFDTPVFADLCELTELLSIHTGQDSPEDAETVEVM